MFPHVLYKPKNTNSTVDAMTPWLSVKDGSLASPDSNGSAAPLVTSVGDVQKRDANPTVDVSRQLS